MAEDIEKKGEVSGIVWHRRPGDQVYHPVRIKHHRLRRALGVAALYSAGYGNVGSSIYYALGIVALVAGGAAPVALAVAGIFFVFTALTYAEGTAMFPEAGGSATLARQGFNELVGFVSGWALMLSYIVTISISAYTIPPYLGNLSVFFPFLEPLKDSESIGTAVAIGIVVFLVVVNVIGVKETSLLNVSAAIIDVSTQGLLIVLGLTLLFKADVFLGHMFDYWPSPTQLVYGIAIAAVAYTGVETVSQLAEETKQPEMRVPKALVLMLLTVLIMFSGISVAAFSAMTPTTLATTWARDPVAGIANSLPVEWLRNILTPLVAILASTILLIATNAGILGVSRLAFSMSTHQHLPPLFIRIHPKFRTPYASIITAASVAVALMVPGLFGSGIFVDLGGLYTFGSLLAFTLAHASILALRWRRPDFPRPFRLRPSLPIGRRRLPLTALLGFLATGTVWLVLISVQPFSRWVGLSWLTFGVVLYIVYRRQNRLSLLEPAKKVEPVA